MVAQCYAVDRQVQARGLLYLRGAGMGDAAVVVQFALGRQLGYQIAFDERLHSGWRHVEVFPVGDQAIGLGGGLPRPAGWATPQPCPARSSAMRAQPSGVGPPK